MYKDTAKRCSESFIHQFTATIPGYLHNTYKQHFSTLNLSKMSPKTILSILGGLLASQVAALPAPQALDFDLLDALPPAPTPTIATGVLSQSVTVNTASIVASIVQEIATSSPTPSSYDDYNDYNDYDGQSYQKMRKVKRAACGPMPVSSYNYRTPNDTANGFLSDATFSSAALSATTPDGWTQTFSNQNGSTSAYVSPPDFPVVYQG